MIAEGLGEPARMLASKLTIALAAVALVTIGCHGGAATTKAPAPTQTQRDATLPQGMVGHVWLVEGPEGWVAGELGGSKKALAENEVGIVAANGWVASANFQTPGSNKLSLRHGVDGEPMILDVGDVAPTSVAFSRNSAYVSGIVYDGFRDPGIVSVDLTTGSIDTILTPTDTKGARAVVLSEDGSTLVTSLCDPTGQATSCDWDVLDIAKGSTRHVDAGFAGLPLGSSSFFAVLAPQTESALPWVAGVDLLSGKELWRLEGEVDGWLFGDADSFVLSRIQLGSGPPTLLVESVDLATGSARLLYSESRDDLRQFWPTLSTGDYVVIASGRAVRDALLSGGYAEISASVVATQTEDGGAEFLPLWGRQ